MRTRTTAVAHHHRPTEKLFGRDANQLLQCGPHDRALRQQSNGGFASADAPAGTADASIPIRQSSTTVFLPPWRSPQSVPTRTPLNKIRELPILAIPILFDLADRDPGLRSPGSHRLLRHKYSWSAQVVHLGIFPEILEWALCDIA